MKRMIVGAMLIVLAFHAGAQDTVSVPQTPRGGVYDRPYLFRPSARVAIGGYAETMLRAEWEEGIHENISFEARRFNIFIFSSIAPFIKFTSELEFEHGTEEIKLEMAQIDILFAEEFNLRGGIVLSPIGKFNLAHDSPRNEFTDRPLVSTRVIPSTLSEAGLGLFGGFYPFGRTRFTYEAYLVNGLNNGILLDGDGTDIPAGRPRSFEADNNGSPALVGRVALNPNAGGELGLSLHTGAYNTYKVDGLDVDNRRDLTIVAFDAEYEVGGLSFKGEYARARIGVPLSLHGVYARSQHGFYAQMMYDLFSGLLPAFPLSALAAGARYDYVDLDSDVTGHDIHRLSVGFNLRLAPETVVKLDYQRNWMFDRINNMTRSAVIQFGFATYF